MDAGKIANISNLGLAHLGDAVFELMVRVWLCERGEATSKGLHNAAVMYVSAQAQAEAVRKLLPVLSAIESAVFRRGRNTHVRAIPQSATIEEYHAATGLETLFGYLYLRGETQRLNELFNLAMGEKPERK